MRVSRLGPERCAQMMTGGIRFLPSRGGARIAYSVFGTGPPLVVGPPWASHLEAQRSLSGFAAFMETLSSRHTVIVYDRWGTGLSDRERRDFSVAADVQVLTDVVDHLKLRRFSMFAASHAGPV